MMTMPMLLTHWAGIAVLMLLILIDGLVFKLRHWPFAPNTSVIIVIFWPIFIPIILVLGIIVYIADTFF